MEFGKVVVTYTVYKGDPFTCIVFIIDGLHHTACVYLQCSCTRTVYAYSKQATLPNKDITIFSCSPNSETSKALLNITD